MKLQVCVFFYSFVGNKNLIFSLVGKHLNMRLMLPWEEDVNAAAFSLLFLPLTYNFHPIDMVNGKLGNIAINSRLTFDDVIYITKVCRNSTHSIFESGIFGDLTGPDWNTDRKVDRKPTTHYAIAIEWMEAAEM